MADNIVTNASFSDYADIRVSRELTELCYSGNSENLMAIIVMLSYIIEHVPLFIMVRTLLCMCVHIIITTVECMLP